MTNSSKYNYKLYSIICIGLDIILIVVIWSLVNYIKNSQGSFRFENSGVLNYIFLLPVFSILFILQQNWKYKALNQFGNLKLIQDLIDTGKTRIALVKHILQKFALLFLLIALANPQYGTSKKTAISTGSDIMIALDVSNSMLAEDMSGGNQRLKMAKLAIEKLIYQLNGDRIGIVVFAGSAFKQLPITNDYEMALMYLSSVSPGMLSNQGTAIGTAIDSCVSAFKPEDPASKLVIVISDGENHEDDAIVAAKNALAKGITIHTIGMGSLDGSTIPIYKNDLKQGVKRDENGDAVITKMSPELMQEIATAGGGIYKYGEGSDLGLTEIIDYVNKLEKVPTKNDVFSEYKDQFQFYLLLGFIFLIIDFLILNKTKTWLGTSL